MLTNARQLPHPHRAFGCAPLRRLLLVLVACLPCAACATTVGTVAGPVTGPITFWRHTHGIPDWVKAVLTPVMIPLGPILGMTEGARADLGFLYHGEYGGPNAPPFAIVFDPASMQLERPPMLPAGSESGSASGS